MSYELNQWIDVIMSHQKKDDLADSFLQGWYVLNNMNEDKLYSEWKILYDNIVIKVADLVEEKKETKIKKLKKALRVRLSDEKINNHHLKEKEIQDQCSDQDQELLIIKHKKIKSGKSDK